MSGQKYSMAHTSTPHGGYEMAHDGKKDGDGYDMAFDGSELLHKEVKGKGESHPEAKTK